MEQLVGARAPPRPSCGILRPAQPLCPDGRLAIHNDKHRFTHHALASHPPCSPKPSHPHAEHLNILSLRPEPRVHSNSVLPIPRFQDSTQHPVLPSRAHPDPHAPFAEISQPPAVHPPAADSLRTVPRSQGGGMWMPVSIPVLIRCACGGEVKAGVWG
ncbi:hypothetical protein CALVIDRAFT_128126 [Calocera viscosa TUFC12733]|uniref:Uncharacterized protein n=1 Tax=Calocera viscosa (strain TUFC12733) TaxID=1330018 RepID=A0A167RSW7_CALVF|nr:hypothetical protein CALVIDRAFT_128126 [Calocera viscosa TUFC12733]